MQGYIIGLAVGMVMMGIISILATVNAPTKEQVGYSYGELNSIKEHCEKDLPRNTNCAIVVYYLPQAELEE